MPHQERVVIGVDPHKLSATIEVVDERERLLARARFGTDRAGYAAMVKYARGWLRADLGSRGSQRCLRPAGVAPASRR